MVQLKPWGAEVWLANGVRVRLQVYAPDTVRVRMAPAGEYRRLLVHEMALDRPEPTSAAFSLRRGGAGYVLSTAQLSVRIEGDPFRLSLLDSTGRVLTQQRSGAWWGSGWMGETLTCRKR